MRFVWLDQQDGTKVPINPDQVAYLRRSQTGATEVVFGAVNGGLHSILVAGSGESVAARISGGADQIPEAPARPRSPKRHKPKA